MTPTVVEQMRKRQADAQLLDQLIAAERASQQRAQRGAVANAQPRLSELPSDMVRGLLDPLLQADLGINEAMDYYLGPTGIPDRLRAVSGLLDPGVYETGYAAADLVDPRVSDADRYRASQDVAMGLALAPMAFMRPAQGAVGDAMQSARGDVREFLRSEYGGVPVPGANAVDPAIAQAEEVLGLIRAGRADEVTREMLDMGDDVLNARLNEHLWNNYDLPMDEASRMERARGFQGGLYSGTGDNFTAFSGQSWATDNPDLAYTYAPSVGGSVMPLMMRAKHGAPVINAGGANWNALTPSMREGGPQAPYLRGILTDPEDLAKYGEDILTTQNFADAAKEQGFSGVTFNDIVDVGGYLYKHFPAGPQREAQLASIGRAGQPSKVEMRLYPNQVRSRFARFDPRLRHLDNLNAALAAGAPLGLLAMQPDEEY